MSERRSVGASDSEPGSGRGTAPGGRSAVSRRAGGWGRRRTGDCSAAVATALQATRRRPRRRRRRRRLGRRQGAWQGLGRGLASPLPLRGGGVQAAVRPGSLSGGSRFAPTESACRGLQQPGRRRVRTGNPSPAAVLALRPAGRRRRVPACQPRLPPWDGGWEGSAGPREEENRQGGGGVPDGGLLPCYDGVPGMARIRGNLPRAVARGPCYLSHSRPPELRTCAVAGIGGRRILLR
jgi:hypothetical protein